MTCRSLLLAVFLGLAASAGAPPRLALQPLGPVEARTLDLIAVRLRQVFTFQVEVLPPAPLPSHAFYEPRKRYRAEKLLDHLDQNTSGEFEKVLGVTERDISTTKDPWPDWGIFGLAYQGSRPAVLSSFRLRRNADRKLFLERLYKVAIHEVAHTLGLDHCPERGCVMEDACGTIVTVDRGTERFCEACRSRIKAYLR